MMNSFAESSPGLAKSFVRAARLAPSALTGRYCSTGHLESSQCLIVLSFGYRKNSDGQVLPGPVNEQLAQEAVRLGGDIDIFAQAEVHKAIVKLTGNLVHCVAPKGVGTYFDTHAFFDRCETMLTTRGFRKAIIVAHPHHVPRVQAVARNHGITAYTPPGIYAIWDKHSEQRWTRSPFTWARRELLVLFAYALRGWL